MVIPNHRLAQVMAQTKVANNDALHIPTLTSDHSHGQLTHQDASGNSQVRPQQKTHLLDQSSVATTDRFDPPPDQDQDLSLHFLSGSPNASMSSQLHHNQLLHPLLISHTNAFVDLHSQLQQIKQLQHLDQLTSRQNSNGYEDFKDYDLKSRESKYRRWTPRMDQYLIKLLSDIVHSYPKDAEVEMTKKAWAYLCGQLRAANPETVYSTYTKYSCQQHLLNVIHHRYKIWYVLMVHQKTNNSNGQNSYSYRWNPDLGRFQIIDNTTRSLILDERQVKSLLYSESLSLPSLSSFNRGNLIVNDFFLTDNLKYMSVYHNEILPLLIRLDPKYADGLENVYDEIPKFDYHEANNEYFKQLVPPKLNKAAQQQAAQNASAQVAAAAQVASRLDGNAHSTAGLVSKGKKRLHPNGDIGIMGLGPQADDSTNPAQQDDDSVDPALKRSRALENQKSTQKQQEQQQQQAAAVAAVASSIDFESALASAAIAAIQSPPVVNGSSSVPFYVKDRKWFYKLVSLSDGGLLSIEEVLQVCEGVRDGKIPIFMLNVLDTDYYPTRNSVIDELPDDEIAKRIRDFMLPMVYNS